MSIKIALVGNPNCGKTTLFNELTGENQFVGNWPGVTVEKKEGKLLNYNDVIITDLPGIYSLSPYTLEEVVARNYLVNEKPNGILNIIDGTNLERNLYLTTQVLEIGIPVVIAINMMDVVKHNGDYINIEELSKKINCPIYAISALKGIGCIEACEGLMDYISKKKVVEAIYPFSGMVEHTIAHIEEACVHEMPENIQRWYAIKIFERDKEVLKDLKLDKTVLSHVECDIKRCEIEMDDDSESIITNERYEYVGRILQNNYKKKNAHLETITDKIDNIITNRVLGLPIFAFIMFMVYYFSMGTIGAMASEWANNNLFGEGFLFFGKFIPGIPVLVENFLTNIHTSSILIRLIVDGMIGGVGSVLGFVPQLVILFFLLAFLEACGYMSRIAFVLDRIFRHFGLSGKSFIPILIGTGCSVPGIMATRTIENESDRRMTITVTSFMPCSAKAPVIALIAGSIFNKSAVVSVSAYFMGMIAIIISGLMLKKLKMFSGKTSPFVMELPPYHMPTIKSLLRVTWERTSSFVKKAGTIILLSAIIVWLLTNFGYVNGQFIYLNEDNLNMSFLGKIGNIFAVIFVPLGFGKWQTTVATITGLVAKENIVSTMGVLYSSNKNIFDTLKQVFTPISAYSFLVFNILCAPCIAAMSTIKNEMNSAKWTMFAIGYQCLFAYSVSLMINQFGNAISGNTNIFWLSIAIIILLLELYLIIRPQRKITK